ncbi:transcription elongation factor GreA [Candidatus Shapirobacteria bacterium]|nr:MAG: transcription elongation factor GreA [Candidatus Shapirobacteria bacterium]
MSQILLTKNGYQRLQQELRELRSQKNHLITEIGEVAQPDESGEDSLATQLKEELGLVNDKLEKIETVLATAKIMNGQIDSSRVQIGTKVKIKLQGKMEREFSIVSQHEADPSQQMISDQSPLGQALLGKQVNQVVDFDAPIGKLSYKILSIAPIV